MDYRDFLPHSKPTPRAESQRAYERGWERVFLKGGVNDGVEVRADERCPPGQTYLFSSRNEADKFFPPEEDK